jgi:hypothetical protein
MCPASIFSTNKFYYLDSFKETASILISTTGMKIMEFKQLFQFTLKVHGTVNNNLKKADQVKVWI